jgi:hypothetical protein
MKRSPAIAEWDSRTPDGVTIRTGVPGAVVELFERAEGVMEGRNGAGSVVELIFPHGVQGADFDGWD